MMTHLGRLSSLLLIAAAAFPAAADTLVLPERTYERVVVTESARAYYVRNPEDGSVQPVPKETLSGEARVVLAPDDERERLYAAWRERYSERREAAKAERRSEAEQTEVVKERQALGLRMAEEDVQRIASHDITFHRRDRHWRRHKTDEDALRLLLSGEDDATVRLAAMAAESQLIREFVNMRLVEGVKQSWLRQGWQDKDAAERDKALVIVTAVVKREAKTSLERDATMAYIHRHVEEWE
jgi:hypothetical protein